MSERYLDVLATKMHDGIERLIVHAVRQKVGESVARQDASAVEHDSEARVEVGVVAKHQFDELTAEGIVFEERSVRLKEDCCAVLVLSLFGDVAFEVAFAEHYLACLSVAVALHLETVAQGIDCLKAHTVQSYTLLERLTVVLATRIEHRHGFHYFAEWNATSVVANRHTEIVVDIYFDAFSGTHLELVDAVVDDFLEQDIDAVLCLRAVTEASDVHTGTRSDVLHIGEVSYITFVVLC